MPLDFDIDVKVRPVAPSAAEMAGVSSQIRRALEASGAAIRIDTGSAASGLGRVSSGAQASAAALAQARDQAQQLNASLRATVSLGAQSAGILTNLGQQAGLAARRFVAMAVAARAIEGVVSAFRQGVSAAVEFDLAMNKIRQASTETADQLSAIKQNITSLATTYGVSSKELAEAGLVIKSAGYSIRETNDVLRAISLTGVASQFGSIKETAQGSVAIMRQFNIAAGDMTATLGGVNAVSKAFAIEANDIVEGVKKAGGAFAAVGGNIQEFEGLMTAVRGTTRESAEEIATGLRTIFTRLQRTDTVQALKDLGVNLRYTRTEADALGNSSLENQFVGAYEAVRRLSSGLEGLRSTDPRYSAVVEQLGGYRQISRVIPLLKNFEDAERAKNVALAGGVSLTQDAATRQEALSNSLDKVREKWLATIRAIVETKGFQSLANSLVSVADGLARVVDFAKPLVPIFATLAAAKIGSALPGILSSASGAFAARVGSSLPPIRRAGGGTVPGSGTGDSVPALLTPGEFVVRKAAVQRVGVDNLRALNEGGRVRVERFALGGMVGGFRGYAGGDLVEGGFTTEQEGRIAKALRSGLVESLVRKFERNPSFAGVDVESTINDSLYRSAKQFDEGRGVPFNAFVRQNANFALLDASKKSRPATGAINDLPVAATGVNPVSEAIFNEQLVAVEARKLAMAGAGGLPPNPPAVAAPGSPEPDPAGSRFAQLNALRRDGTRSLPLTALGELGLPKTATDALTTEARTVAAEAGKLADAMAGATNVVVQMKGGLARVSGLRDVGGRSALASVPLGGPMLPVAGPLASFGDVGGFPSPVDPASIQEARFTQEARTRDYQRAFLADAEFSTRQAQGRADRDHADSYRRDIIAPLAARREAETRFGDQIDIEGYTRRVQRDEAYRLEQMSGVSPSFRQRVVGGVRGAAASVAGRYRATNERVLTAAGKLGFGSGTGTALLIGGSYAADQLDREGRSTTSRGLGGALQGAVVGGAAGSILPGIGTVVGAVAGGLAGLVSSLDDAAKDISRAKVNDALTGFADRLNSVNTALAGGGLSNVSPGALADLSARFQTERAEQRAANQREATHTLSGFDSDEFNRLQVQSDRKNFAGQLPGIQQFLNAQATELGKADLGADAKTIVARLLNANGGANRDLAGLVANVRQLSPAEFTKELQKTIVSAQQAKRVEDAQKAGRDSVEVSTNAFGRLLLAVQSASGSLDGLHARAQALGDVFDNTVSAVHVTGADRAGQLGRNDRGALAAFSAVAAATGGPGVALRSSATAVDDVARVLPGVLVQAANGRRGADQDVATTVNTGLLHALGITDASKTPPELQRVLNVVRSGISTQVGDKGEKPFGDAVALDVSKEAERLLAPVADPLKEIGAKIAQELQDQSNRFIDGLAVLAKRTEQVGQAQDAAANLGVGAFRTELQVRAFRAGRPNQALDFASLAQLEAGQTARQERLAGVAGPRAFDVEDIARRLEQTQRRIPGAIDRQQAAAQRTGGRGPAFEAAAKGLSDLQSESTRLLTALRNLADVSTRTAEVQERLGRLQQERQGRRGLVERFLTADPDQAIELNRGLLLANGAANRGSFDGLLPADAKSAIDFLRSAGGSTLTGFRGSPRADDLLNKLLDATAGGIAGLSKGGAAEERRLQAELVKRSADAASAAGELAKALERSSTAYFDNLKSQQEQFFGRLVQELSSIHLADLTNKAAKVGTEAKDADTLAGQASLLKGIGFSTGGQVRTNFDKVQEYVEATSTILDRQKRAAGAAGLIVDKSPADIIGDRGRDKFLTQTFPELDEAARGRVGEEMSRKYREYYDRVGDIPDLVATRQHLAGAVRHELTNESAGPYRAAEDRQGEAYRQLVSIRGFDFNKLNDLAATADGMKKLNLALDAFRDGKSFEDLDKKSHDLQTSFDGLNAAVRAVQDTINTTKQGQAQAGVSFLGGALAAGHAAGGSIFRPRGTDTVPAMLTPGEFVVRRQAAEANRGLLERINAANGPLYKADGGLIGFMKKAVGGVVETVKDAGQTAADAAGYGPEGRRREELEKKLAEAKGKPVYRAEGGIADLQGRYDSELADLNRRFPGSDVTPEYERARRELEDRVARERDSLRQTGGYDNPFLRLSAPRLVDDTLQQPDVPGRGGLLRPYTFEEQLRAAQANVERARRRAYAANPDNEPGLAKGRSGAYTPIQPGPYDPASIREDLNPLPALPSYRRDDVEYPTNTAKAGDPVIPNAAATKRAYDIVDEIKKQGFEKGTAFTAHPTRAKVGPAPRVVADDDIPAGTYSALQREAALNPYGASALFLAGRSGGDRAVNRLALTGQISDFNRRSYAANYLRDRTADQSFAARQSYNQRLYQQSEAYRNYQLRKQQQGLHFAGGGMVPGVGTTDSVPALLTPGEFVLRKEAVQRMGVAGATHFNAGGPVYRADGGSTPSSGGGGDWSQLASSLAQFGQAATGLGSTAQLMAQAMTSFSAPAQALTKALEAMPRTLNVTGQHTVAVNLNGAEVLGNLQPAIEKLVVGRVNERLNAVLKNTFPDASLAPV